MNGGGGARHGAMAHAFEHGARKRGTNWKEHHILQSLALAS